MEVCERVGTSRMILGVVEVISIKCSVVLGELGEKVLKCLLEVNYGSYFCFSDCVALTTTVPFHRLLALTAFIFRAADFIGYYTSAICHQWEVHRLSEHADRLSR